ncbi:iron ABC transporter ATP-binding protein [Pseudorhodobacter aquimaris]|uniref:iron ABC transporter ATP-binding protein n=1 Tax=Pseudorhodobacter aquimaris TaxID=687412 RepID=UPI00067D0090|nr:ATP-binding cassette domain-containing protein [Pseudorhodobacter aquimaris]
MICVEGVSHSIGKTEILHDISVEIPKGKVTALVGPNGAGKSTLLSLIGRLMPLQSGRISVDGADTVQTPSRDLARLMAILSQTNTLGSRLRVRELVAFGRWPHHQGRPTAEDVQQVNDALVALDLIALGDRFLEALSGGQRQRAFIAMALAQGADWLLLDEPLAALDMAFARRIMAQLVTLRAAGRSVVVVVHDINHAAVWADHIVAMKAGRIAAEGPPQAVCTSKVLGDIYGMDLRVTEIDGKPLVLHHL